MPAALSQKCCWCHKAVKVEKGLGQSTGEKEGEQALLIREMLILGNDSAELRVLQLLRMSPALLQGQWLTGQWPVQSGSRCPAAG